MSYAADVARLTALLAQVPGAVGTDAEMAALAAAMRFAGVVAEGRRPSDNEVELALAQVADALRRGAIGWTAVIGLTFEALILASALAGDAGAACRMARLAAEVANSGVTGEVPLARFLAIVVHDTERASDPDAPSSVLAHGPAPVSRAMQLRVMARAGIEVAVATRRPDVAATLWVALGHLHRGANEAMPAFFCDVQAGVMARRFSVPGLRLGRRPGDDDPLARAAAVAQSWLEGSGPLAEALCEVLPHLDNPMHRAALRPIQARVALAYATACVRDAVETDTHAALRRALELALATHDKGWLAEALPRLATLFDAVSAVADAAACRTRLRLLGIQVQT